MRDQLNNEVTGPVGTSTWPIIGSADDGGRAHFTACSPDDDVQVRWLGLHREHTDAVATARSKLVRYLVTEGFERCYRERRRPPGHFADPTSPGEQSDDDDPNGAVVAGGGGSRRGLS